MTRVYILLILLINIVITLYVWKYWRLVNNTKHVETNEYFIPSKEWKRIGKNQLIPRGLHVRINIETGEKEGRLLETEKDEELNNYENSLILVGDKISPDRTIEELKETLKKVKNEAKESQLDQEPERKFRTYEELKKELSDVNLNVKTDLEVLSDIFTKFKAMYSSSNSWCVIEDTETISTLNDLENLLHQGDNAEEFAKLNGFISIIKPCLLSNSSELKTLGARVLGAAVQNNARAQIAALKADVIVPLLRVVKLERQYKPRSSAIFALSCLIRLFPLAEMNLIDADGLSILLDIFNETSADAYKLQMKLVMLFSDLIMEREDAEFSIIEEKALHDITDIIVAQELEQMREKLKQYNDIGLKTKLIEHGWCSRLENLLITGAYKKNIDRMSEFNETDLNHDVVEKLANAMLPVAIQCKNQFKNDIKFTPVIINLLKDYKILSSKDNFYGEIYEVLSKLNFILYP